MTYHAPMVFCQSCGERNLEGARFCNMCGAKIAQPLEPGGPIPHASPAEERSNSTQGAHSMSSSSISLDAIGVRSSTRTYVIFGLAGALLFSLGALGMWFLMRPGTAPDSMAEQNTDDEPIEIGEPMPVGQDIPDVDFVPGTPSVTSSRPTKRTGSSSSTPSTPATSTPATSTPATSTPATSTRTPASPGAVTTRTDETPRSSSSTSASGSSTEQPAPAATSEGSSSPSAPVDWERAGGGSEASEEDILLDAYASHVRRHIREYYARRAQTCFDHESRLDQSAVRGTVLIGFTIMGSGEVRNTTIDRNTTGRDSLASCLERQVASWRLPRPPEGIDELPMQMPFSR